MADDTRTPTPPHPPTQHTQTHGQTTPATCARHWAALQALIADHRLALAGQVLGKIEALLLLLATSQRSQPQQQVVGMEGGVAGCWADRLLGLTDYLNELKNTV